MKLAISVSVLIILVSFVHAQPSYHTTNRRLKRGFKDNIAMGHGFGKRTESRPESRTSIHNFFTSQRRLMSNHKLAEILREKPGLANAIVAKFVDTNGDGYVSADELFPEGGHA